MRASGARRTTKASAASSARSSKPLLADPLLLGQRQSARPLATCQAGSRSRRPATMAPPRRAMQINNNAARSLAGRASSRRRRARRGSAALNLICARRVRRKTKRLGQVGRPGDDQAGERRRCKRSPFVRWRASRRSQKESGRRFCYHSPRPPRLSSPESASCASSSATGIATAPWPLAPRPIVRRENPIKRRAGRLVNAH